MLKLNKRFNLEKNGHSSLSQTIDLPRLRELIQLSFKKIEDAKDKPLIPVIGSTGAGKSTTIGYLMGREFEEIQIGSQFIPMPKDQEDKYPVVGHHTVSQTLFPQAYEGEGHIYYCDCPGFADNRGKEENICTTMNIQIAIESASIIPAVIVVIEYSALYAQRGSLFIELVQTLAELFKNPAEVSNSIVFAVTKLDPRLFKDKDKTKTGLLARCAELIQSTQQSIELLSQQVQAEENFCEQEAMIKILKLISKENLVLVDPLDLGKSRNEMVEVVKKAYPIPKNAFNFSQTSGHRNAFNNVMFEISGQGLKLLEGKAQCEEISTKFVEQRENHQKEKAYKHKKLEEAEAKIHQLKKEIVSSNQELNALNGDYQDRTKAIETLKSKLTEQEEKLEQQKDQIRMKIAQNEKQIIQIKGKVDLARISKVELEEKINVSEKELMTHDSQELVLHYNEKINEDRPSFFAWGKTYKTFKYEDQPFDDVKVLYDQKTGELWGEFSTPPKGKYEVTYISNRGKSGIAELQIFIQKRNKKDMVKLIQTIKTRIQNQKNEMSKLQKNELLWEKEIETIKYEIEVMAQQELERINEKLKRLELDGKELTENQKEVQIIKSRKQYLADTIKESHESIKDTEKQIEMVQKAIQALEQEISSQSKIEEEMRKDLKEYEETILDLNPWFSLLEEISTRITFDSALVIKFLKLYKLLSEDLRPLSIKTIKTLTPNDLKGESVEHPVVISNETHSSAGPEEKPILALQSFTNHQASSILAGNEKILFFSSPEPEANKSTLFDSKHNDSISESNKAPTLD